MYAVKMSVKEETICRLCIKTIENEFEVIDEITRQIFDALLLNVNLNASENPVICHDCGELVKNSYYFKSNCIDNEKLITSEKQGAKIELKDIYKYGKGSEVVLDEDCNRCRFCTKQMEEKNFMSLNELIRNAIFAEMLPLFMAEMDLDTTNNSIVCVACKENLEHYFKLVRSCWFTEEKINAYRRFEGPHIVKLSDIQNFLWKDNCAQTYKPSLMSVIKEEASMFDGMIENDGLIKSEELDIKDEKVTVKRNSGRCLPPAISLDSGMRMFKCTECIYQTDKKRYLTVHILTHRNKSQVKMYKCTTCTFETKYRQNLKDHALIHRDVSEVDIYKCTCCTFYTKFKNHIRGHMLMHRKSSEVEMYRCASCTYRTRYKKNLVQHMRIHNKVPLGTGKIYNCPNCPYKTKYTSNLYTHSMIHKDISEVETYKCANCPHETRYKRNLIQHMRIHSKTPVAVKTYSCVACSYQTKHKHDLTTHALVHKDASEVEIYKCAMCVYETRYKKCLRAHMLVHRDTSEVKMHKCVVCNFETKYRKCLKRHLLTHECTAK